jgi:hypothetical protein
MLKFSFETYIDGKQTQNLESQIITSFQKYSKINESTLQKIVTKIKQGQQSNLKQGLDVFGKAVAPKKIPNGKPIFVDSGELLQSVADNKISSNEWDIFISANRSRIAQHLIQGRSNMVPRQFFGISDTLNREIDNILEQDYSKI